jgi:predicted ATPase/class 3 adenylate cyclase
VTASRTKLPSGTVTFLRTDVEGSMGLAAALGTRWDDANARQLALIRESVGRHGGVTVRTEGDAVFSAFPDASEAVRAAIDIVRAMTTHPWPDQSTVRVRVGLHSGEAHLAGDDYGGFDVNRAARIAAVGHGGQIVLSDATRALAAHTLPEGASLRDLGRHLLKDVPYPERLFQLDVPGLPSDFPPVRSKLATPGNLPPRLTSFLGREADLREARRLLDTGRLLTITGPGGIGKTSLGIELARAVAPEFADGAWLISLESESEAGQVPAAVARALGIYDGPGRPVADGVLRHLAEREGVLVLDNFEHVIDAAPFVSDLLMGALDQRVIVTSRAPLRISGEQEYPVGPLGGEDGQGTSDLSPAVQLFLDRARSTRPGWDPEAALPIVHEICGLLDDLPLGIELAAARISMLPPSAIRDRLVARLPLPGAGPRNVPDRQRTLEGAIAWSYELLREDQQRLLRQLAVFEAGFDVDQAEQVAGDIPSTADVLDGLIELANQSLLTRAVVDDTGARLGGLRFRMLETIRTFALRELADAGEETDARRRHAAAFLALAEDAARHTMGSDQPMWLDRLQEDHANLREALDWSIDHGPVEVAQRLSTSLWRYWQIRGFLREGRELVDRVVALGPDEPSSARMWSLAAAGGIAYWQADTQRAHSLYLEQLSMARQIGDLAGEADAYFNVSATEFIAGERPQSRRWVMAARELYERLGDEVGAARTLWAEQMLLAFEHRTEEASAVLDEAMRRFDRNGDVRYQAGGAAAMSWKHLLDGNSREALRWCIQSLTLFHAMRDFATTTITLPDAAIILLDLGDAEDAATVMGAYEALSETSGVKPPAGVGYMIQLMRPGERIVEALQEGAQQKGNARGRRLSLDEAVAFALERLEHHRA